MELRKNNNHRSNVSMRSLRTRWSTRERAAFAPGPAVSTAWRPSCARLAYLYVHGLLDAPSRIAYAHACITINGSVFDRASI